MISVKDFLTVLSYLQTIFSVILENQTSANNNTKDLETIHNWAFQWKMNFNPDPTKQAQEAIFSCKAKRLPHPPLMLKNVKL